VMNAMADNTIKKQILAALNHPEAEDGLYFNNLIVVHEEEERSVVEGEESDVRAALKELIGEGMVTSAGEGEQEIFSLA
jgi:hypothetical protein